jgi:hypothetical protein
MFVLPKFVNESEFLYNVEYEYNGVTVQAAFADQQFFFGKGAGWPPYRLGCIIRYCRPAVQLPVRV